MRYDTSNFLAWQEAERLASEAELELYAKLCGNPRGLPAQQEVERARALRAEASRRMRQMLSEMRDLAEVLRCSRELPGAPVNVAGFRAEHRGRDS